MKLSNFVILGRGGDVGGGGGVGKNVNFPKMENATFQKKLPAAGEKKIRDFSNKPERFPSGKHKENQ